MQASLCLLRKTFKVTELVCTKLKEERVRKMMYGRNPRLREACPKVIQLGSQGFEIHTQLCLVLEPVLTAQVITLLLGTPVHCVQS